MIKLAIAEDNSFLLKTVIDKLAFFDDLMVKFKANNGLDLLEKISKNHNIDIVLMDIEMPKIDGIEATLLIKNKYPHIKVIMLTVFDNDENIFNAIKNGADGYLLKEVTQQDLYTAIIETLNGGAIMTPSIALKTLRLFRNPVDFNKDKNKEQIKLTQQEIKVLEQLSSGLKYDAIAHNLIVSNGTIRKHVEHIYRKLQVNSRLEAIEKARFNNLI
jgi:DNA-binding NarL/FixJ family response regulator